MQLDAANRTLQAQMQANVRERDEADAESAALLDALDEVRDSILGFIVSAAD